MLDRRITAPMTALGHIASASRRLAQDALSALLGPDAPNLSPSVIGRLKGEWEAAYLDWQERDLSSRRNVWADGVYLQARMEPQAESMLVIIGATPEGKKELLGFQVGFRESAQNWKELLVDLKAKGLTTAPELPFFMARIAPLGGSGRLGARLDASPPSIRRHTIPPIARDWPLPCNVFHWPIV